MQRKECLCRKTWQDNGNMDNGEIERKGKEKRMRISVTERAEVTEPKEKWKCNKKDRKQQQWVKYWWREFWRMIWSERCEKWAEWDLLVCQQLWIQPTPLGEKKRKESRDIDLALFMLNAIGSGTRCFTLCLHREATMTPKTEETQPGGQFVCSL